MDEYTSNQVTNQITRFNTYFDSIDWSQIIDNIISGILSLIFTVILYYIVRKIGQKIIRKIFISYSKRENVSENRSKTLFNLIDNAFRYILIFILTVNILSTFNVDVRAIIASAGIVGLAVAFGAQGLVSDVVTGFFILLERQLDVGDNITIGAVKGTVELLGLRTTQIRDLNGTLHFIPNREIIVVSNHSRGNMLALVEIQINPNEDIDKAIALIEETTRAFTRDNPNIVDTPIVSGVTGYANGNFVVTISTHTLNGTQLLVSNELYQKIYLAFQENELLMPLSLAGLASTQP
ncbi:mechanosensitive ion channel family protein [Brochothrix campestris]|uniref:Mechanosensitive ion channel family protein n=1 Tax=Brochothrix campestris FSL F6-1037 TaxID=1265861 RepID=W7CTG3_9LIST|nr:mechanosensitive ion channel family protein [Brochothrix campestris]EUJ39101.1 mechanosensitive ion channel family protein [Brochothrix campestris FSL F6-1037]